MQHRAEQVCPLRPDQTVILIAEDEALVRKVVGSALQREGYFLLIASDGSEALKLSRTYPGPIHLLLVDIAMPGLGGLDLCREIRRDRQETKMIVMSGHPQQRVSFPFLQKPFDLWELREKVRQAIPEPVLIPRPLTYVET